MHKRKKGKPTATNLDEFLFANKNRDYGAFVHRRVYRRNLVYAVFFGISIMSLIYLAPLLWHWISKEERTATEVIPVTLTPASELVAPPPVLPDEPPPPPEPQEKPPQVATKRFVKPEIRPDEEVLEEDLPPTVEELQKAAPARVTREGVIDLHRDFVMPEPVPQPEPEPEPKPEPEPEEPQIFTAVEQWPEFPGGEEAMFDFIRDNLEYPIVARQNRIQGMVVIQFVVREDGSIENPQVVRGIGGGCDEEAIRVVGQMPRWIPGRQQDKTVSVKYTLPIRFTLRN